MSTPLLLDLRQTVIQVAAPVLDIPGLEGLTIIVSSSRQTTNKNGQVTPDTLSSPNRHVFSGWVRIDDPKAVEGGVEFSRFRIVHMLQCFPVLDPLKVDRIFAFEHADIATASFSELWTEEADSQPDVPPEPVETLPVLMRSSDKAVWKPMARQRGKEILTQRAASDWYPNLLDVGDQIAREFRGAGTFGAHGKPLTGETIKRHALQGIHRELKLRKPPLRNRGK